MLAAQAPQMKFEKGRPDGNLVKKLLAILV